jgi:uncharacterized protein (DUF2236 family)
MTTPVDSLFSPDSVTWKIHSDPSMVVGGIRALLEQALHPVAMDGVAKNSNFREDAWGRLQRTGDYVATITFAPRTEAEKLSARVRSIHTKLGLDNPHELLWVHMAMVDSFLDVAIRSGLSISSTEADQYLDEMVEFAVQVGIPAADVPRNQSELKQYFVDISPELSATDDAKRAALFLAIPPMSPVIRFATPAAPAWGSLVSLATASLPAWARRLYNVPSLPGQTFATDLALKSVRRGLLVLPQSMREGPVYKAARERMATA